MNPVEKLQADVAELTTTVPTGALFMLCAITTHAMENAGNCVNDVMSKEAINIALVINPDPAACAQAMLAVVNECFTKINEVVKEAHKSL